MSLSENHSLNNSRSADGGYSMESRSRDITVYQTPFLRSVVQLLKERLEGTKAQPFDRLIWPTPDS